MTTLAIITNEIRVVLSDFDAATLRSDSIEQGIRQALRRINQVSRYQTVGTNTIAAASRELSLASLGSSVTPADVSEIWLPYTAASPEDPPRRRIWAMLTESTLWLADASTPAIADVARVFYRTPHTLSGLDSAASTTLDTEHLGALVSGSACETLLSRYRQISETRKTAETGLDSFSNPNISQVYERHRRIFDAFIESRRIAAAGSFVSWTIN